MKTWMITVGAARKLGLLTSILAALGGLSAGAAEIVIVNETFDPPTLATPGGWENGVVESLSREYVKEGTGHSSALRISAAFPGQDYAAVYSGMFQCGVMGGNDWATRENTVLSFDIKIDTLGLSYVGVYLDGFAEYLWNYGDPQNATFSGAVVPIALGSYQPGVIKQIVISLADSRWMQVYPWPDTSHLAPFFDPSARTYNSVTFVVDSSCLPVPGSFAVTVDNVRITTKNPMVPFNGKGELTVLEDESILFKGAAEHLGVFKQNFVFPPGVWAPGTFELTAANGDTLCGSVHYAGVEWGLQIEKGTGRFLGAVGSYRAVITNPESPDLPVIFRGAISSVGWNRK